jgi:hypothetical protein
MESTGAEPPRSFFKRHAKLLVVLIIVVFAFASASVFLSPAKALTKEEVALNKAVRYFTSDYNVTIGLVPETPGGSTYWLYSDNYLASLALVRFDPANQSTVGFGKAIGYVVQSYAATAPPSLLLSDYSVLNSTEGSFGCPTVATMTWTDQGNPPASGHGGAVIKTVANVGDPSCAKVQQDYADLLLLQAILASRHGDSSSALSFYRAAAADFDGTGVKDAAFTNSTSDEHGVYQTYKVALYLYAAVCLSQGSADTNLPALEPILLAQEDNATGGFYTGYTSSAQHTGTVNTETTALAALALELIANPTSQC